LLGYISEITSLWDWCHNPCFSSASWCNFHHKNSK